MDNRKKDLEDCHKPGPSSPHPSHCSSLQKQATFGTCSAKNHQLMFKGYNKGSEVWVWRTQVMNDGWESSQEILNWKNSSEERSRMELCGRAFIISQKQTHCSHTYYCADVFPSQMLHH
jgi:hypothetical protein